MSVPGIGYVVHNKARVALERAFRNPRKRVMGVDWEFKLTFGFKPQGMGVGHTSELPFARIGRANTKVPIGRSGCELVLFAIITISRAGAIQL